MLHARAENRENPPSLLFSFIVLYTVHYKFDSQIVKVRHGNLDEIIIPLLPSLSPLWHLKLNKTESSFCLLHVDIGITSRLEGPWRANLFSFLALRTERG